MTETTYLSISNEFKREYNDKKLKQVGIQELGVKNKTKNNKKEGNSTINKQEQLNK